MNKIIIHLDWAPRELSVPSFCKPPFKKVKEEVE